jgi:hypothetical protein
MTSRALNHLSSWRRAVNWVTRLAPEAVTEVSDTADLSMPVRCRMCRMLGRQRISVRVS